MNAQVFAALVAAGLLAACSGGGGGGAGIGGVAPVAPPPPPPPPPPPGLAGLTAPTGFSQQASLVSVDTTTNAVTVDLTGAAGETLTITFDPNGSGDEDDSYGLELTDGSGTVFAYTFTQADIDASFDSILAFNPISISSNPGFTDSRLYRLGAGAEADELEVYQFSPSDGQDPFLYSRLVRVLDRTGADQREAFSVIGLQTPGAQMPASGAGQWFGAATGRYENTGGVAYDWASNAQLDYNFATGQVTGTFADFHFLEDGNVNQSVPADFIFGIFLNANLTGSEFAGAVEVDMFNGPDFNGTGVGWFFGPNDGAPVEAGGVLEASDPNQFLIGGFISGPRSP